MFKPIIIIFNFVGNPVVSVSSGGSIIANNIFILECTVTIVAGVLNITWLNETGDQLIKGNGIMFKLVTMSAKVQVYQLIFNPLHYWHIGGYTCQANLTVSSIKEPFIGNGSDATIVNVQGICFSIIIAMYSVIFCYSACSTSENIS